MKNTKALSLLLISLLLLSIVPLSVRAQGQKAEPSPGSHVVDPVPMNFFINGFENTTYALSSPPGSNVMLNLTAVYPWNVYPFVNGPILVRYSFAPFPLSGSTPSWLTPSIQTSSLAMSKGSPISVDIYTSIGRSATIGLEGSFAIDAWYTDPVSGYSVTMPLIINVTTSNLLLLPQTKAQIPNATPSNASSTGNSKSWALGAGLCGTNDNSLLCGGTGVNWGNVNGLEAPLTVPSFADSTTTWIPLTAGIFNSTVGIQSALLAPSPGASTWEEYIYVLNWGVNPPYACGVNIDHVTAGNAWTLAILYITYSAPYTGWYAGSTTDGVLKQLSNYCSYAPGPSTTALYNENQEPVAFESYDANANDFALFSMYFNPAFEYQQSGNWYNPPAAFAINANNGNTNWTLYGGYVVGGGTATPSMILEGGQLQCSSIPTYELYTGYNGNGPCGYGGTQTYLTKLMN
jgi:hypothetical protein